MPKAISTLPVGALVKDTDTRYNNEVIVWRLADKGHAGYPTGAATLLSDRLLSFKSFDAAETAYAAGYSRYAIANIRQWLNREGWPWYAAQHASDTPPAFGNIATGGANRNPYDAETGFLTGFSAGMKGALMNTALIVAKPTDIGGGSETVTDKVFLLSKAEVGLSATNSVTEGSTLPLFSSDATRVAYCTPGALTQGDYPGSGTSIANAQTWWLRSWRSVSALTTITANGSDGFRNAYYCTVCIRPAINIPQTTLVSDNPGSDGAYTIIWNRPPTDPSGVTYVSPKAGKPITITWKGSTDPDGDAIQYVVERRTDNNVYQQRAITAGTTYTDTAPASGTAYQARVKATDSRGLESGYAAGPALAIDYNNPPTVTLTSASDMGEQRGAFNVLFSVNDPDAADVLSVVVTNDGAEVFSVQNAQRNKPLTATVDFNTWAACGHGRHTVEIQVTDGKETASQIVFWTKTIAGIDVRMKTPVPYAQRPQRLLVVPEMSVQSDAAPRYLACNNGFDPAAGIVWEDVTAAALSGVTHTFQNQTKTADQWGVMVHARIPGSAKGPVTLRVVMGVIS